MVRSGNGTATVRFGPFEADLHAGEVRRSGSRIKLQDQPFKVLQILLERPGALVTREELQSRIWPQESFGDFDHAVNVAVGKLRTALGDSADNPSFIETIPRRGYRFVAKLEAAPPPEPPSPRRSVGAPLGIAFAAAALVILGVVIGRRTTDRASPTFRRLTVERGTVYSARFAPDGRGVLYSAAWNGAPIAIYSTDIAIPAARDVGLPSTELLTVSRSGEMAVLQSIDRRFLMTVRGTLSQVPQTGASPRQIAENVDWADWAPDGTTLAIVRDVGGKQQLEYPVGHVLYETGGWISHPRVSPNGDRVAFLDHPSIPDDHGRVTVIDRAGNRRVLSRDWESTQGLAWSPSGGEIWYSATQVGLERRIYAVDLSGRERLVFRAPGGVTLLDIAPDGRALVTRDNPRVGLVALPPGETKERDLSWRDWSFPVAVSADGNTVLFDEQGEQSGPNYTVAVRDMRGSPPIPLGEGMAGDLSPDGKWATTIVNGTRLLLLPTGAGTARGLGRGDIESYSHGARWFRDGTRVAFRAKEPGHGLRCFVQSIDGGSPKAVTPEGVTDCLPSPDGKSIAGGASLYPLDGGAPQPIAGLLPGENFIWTADPQFLYVYQGNQAPPVRVYRLNVLTGQRQLFKEITPADVAGLGPISHVLFSADGRVYVYSYARFLSELYLVTGLK
jgi:DNA-binding winged helix-turn-helix (wHTH) protein/Tol biopolymer transport system component